MCTNTDTNTSSTTEPKIVIIGSGPTGLGSAFRLQELGHQNFVMLDQASTPGGLARSDVDPQGFTWDYGVSIPTAGCYTVCPFVTEFG